MALILTGGVMAVVVGLALMAVAAVIIITPVVLQGTLDDRVNSR